MVTIKQVLSYLIGVIVTGLTYWAKLMSDTIKSLNERLNALPDKFVPRHEMDALTTRIERMDDKLDRVLTAVMDRKK